MYALDLVRGNVDVLFVHDVAKECADFVLGQLVEPNRDELVFESVVDLGEVVADQTVSHVHVLE